MSLDDCCLVSQEIRELARSGAIVDPEFDESRIQPSSFEPTIGEEVYVIDTDKALFRPSRDKAVYRSLLELPARRRQRVDISGGFESKIGFTYLLPLVQRVHFDGFRMIESSPKSSIGRVFPNTRFLTDFNSSFDEALSSYGGDRELMMWLLFQPLAFNLGLFPGISLNQLRFFKGFNAQLTPREIVESWSSNPILYYVDGKAIDTPDMGGALQIHSDVEGRNSEGIVALRARRNPNVIDLTKSEKYSAEDYFEPMNAKGGVLEIKRGEYYLVSSEEVLNVPECCNVELKAHSHQGISGSLHRAGFIDNGFDGDLVFEITSEEATDLEIHHGMSLGEIAVFRTEFPDKLYGDDRSGSHYQFQKGPKTAKYFKSFDFGMAAKNYAKLGRDVLVQDARLLLATRGEREGFEFVSDEKKKKLFDLIEGEGFFHSRYDCERDDLVLQLIPYVLGFNDKREVFSYVRAKDIKDYGDERLFGKHSLGIGGHIGRKDGPNFIVSGLEREVGEEVKISGDVGQPVFLGTLYRPDNPVDKVHFGLVYAIRTNGEIIPRESSISSGRMVNIKSILENFESNKLYETWSRVLIPHLIEFYKMVSVDL